jgi:hypothetical protein
MVETTYEPRYWGKNGRFQKQHDELWEKLIPDCGDADTTHGELLRVACRVYYEHYNNGRCNMAYAGNQYTDVFRPFFLARLERLKPVAERLGYELFECDVNEFFVAPEEPDDDDEENDDYDCYIPDGVVSDEVMDRVVDVVVAYAAEKEGIKLDES